MRILALILIPSLLVGCLKTRAELQGEGSDLSYRPTAETGRTISGQMSQQQRAQIDSRFFEIDRDFRQLYGRIETMEKQLSDLQPALGPAGGDSASAEKLQNLEKRMTTLEEAILSIDKKLSALGATKTSAVATPAKANGPFTTAEIFYAQGEYEKAITSYDRYRKQYPTGKHYAEATLKLGLCFQKLKMNQDAKAFYKEVIQRFPKTSASQQAQKNLKSI